MSCLGLEGPSLPCYSLVYSSHLMSFQGYSQFCTWLSRAALLYTRKVEPPWDEYDCDFDSFAKNRPPQLGLMLGLGPTRWHGMILHRAGTEYGPLNSGGVFSRCYCAALDLRVAFEPYGTDLCFFYTHQGGVSPSELTLWPAQIGAR